jgi:hypothetical protein
VKLIELVQSPDFFIPQYYVSSHTKELIYYRQLNPISSPRLKNKGASKDNHPHRPMAAMEAKAAGA